MSPSVGRSWLPDLAGAPQLTLPLRVYVGRPGCSLRGGNASCLLASTCEGCAWLSRTRLWTTELCERQRSRQVRRAIGTGEGHRALQRYLVVHDTRHKARLRLTPLRREGVGWRSPLPSRRSDCSLPYSSQTLGMPPSLITLGDYPNSDKVAISSSRSPRPRSRSVTRRRDMDDASATGTWPRKSLRPTLRAAPRGHSANNAQKLIATTMALRSRHENLRLPGRRQRRPDTRSPCDRCKRVSFGDGAHQLNRRDRRDIAHNVNDQGPRLAMLSQSIHLVHYDLSPQLLSQFLLGLSRCR